MYLGKWLISPSKVSYTCDIMSKFKSGKWSTNAYNLLLAKYDWECELNIEIDDKQWACMMMKIASITLPTKLRFFQYKVMM